jgi:acyl-CoA synthetase (AMP-forming)/AMP-acid ligase II
MWLSGVRMKQTSCQTKAAMKQRPCNSSNNAKHLVGLLQQLACRQPFEVAFRFLVDGEAEEVSLTYGELDRQARRIAVELTEAGLMGERALLLYPPGLAFIAALFGCFYGGVVAVPAYPPRINRMMARIEAIAEDAHAMAALTTEGVLRRISTMEKNTLAMTRFRWIVTDRIPRGCERRWRMPTVGPDTLAILQYTSGSTGTPKGVMLLHKNLLENMQLISHAFGDPHGGCGVFWLPNYHDMGLVGGILQPLHQGGANTLMAPVAFLQKPLRWLQAITRYRAAISGGPNFAYDLCVDRIPPESRKGLDLSHWRIAFNGAEPVRTETLERFAEAYAPYGFQPQAFYPCYGLAEATLMVSGGVVAEPPKILRVATRSLEDRQVVSSDDPCEEGRRLVGCGRALPGERVHIVDPETRRLCPEDQIGEIWVHGPSVAQGYWNREAETAATFHARPVGSEEGPFLRTGDLGFWKDGELYVTGRIKDLIIIDGRNHFPQDIERTAEDAHPVVQRGGTAAFSVDVDDQEQLVVVAEVARDSWHGAMEAAMPSRRRLDVDAVVQAIRSAVAEQHDLCIHEAVLLRPGSIPKTSSGKIQRHACRAGYLAGTLSVWRSETHGAFASERA